MTGQELSAVATTGAGVGMTQVPINPVQVVGVIVAIVGLAWNVYATITRNRHNKFLRDQARKGSRTSKQ